MGLQNHAFNTLENELPELKLRAGYSMYWIDSDILVVEVYAEDEAQAVLDALKPEFNPELLECTKEGIVIRFNRLPPERLWNKYSREIL